METYQPIYDAVRSRLSNCDVGAAIEAAMRDASIGHYMMEAAESVKQAASEYERPSAVYRPKLTLEGSVWIALYGKHLEEGVWGYGDSPAEAMRAFDKAWFMKINNKIIHSKP